MCTNKHYITNYYGKRILVNCGRCPACLQEKAISRTNKIRNNYPKDGSIMTLFVTLTYRNSACPYFFEDEFYCNPIQSHVIGSDETGKDQLGYFKYLSVYRDITARRDFKNKYKYGRVPLTDICIKAPFSLETKLTPLANSHSLRKKIGVCYYPDLQQFFKRLRQNLLRKYKYELPFTYFACSEYGSDTKRPHFHLLLFVPNRPQAFSLWQRAISEAWPFDGYGLTKRNIEIAKDASSYVASYVNQLATIPFIFRDTKELRPQASYSKGFGVALEYLALPQILEAYRRGDLHVNVTRLRKGAIVVDSVLLPQYVIHRYFPKWKGFSRLSVSEIQSVLRTPSNIYTYAEELKLSKQNCKSIITMLDNKRKSAISQGLDLFEWIECYSRIHALRSSQVLRDWYESISSPFEWFTAYDNIKDFYTGSLPSPTLDTMLFNVPASFDYPVDPNKFPDNVHKTFVLTKLFYDYDKSKKVKNKIYSKTNFHF